jgi:L-arabinose isomerase
MGAVAARRAFGDNMRQVAGTDADKVVDADSPRVAVNGYGVGELAARRR